MIPALTLIVASYVIVRLVQIIRDEFERMADDKYSTTSGVAVVATLALVLTVGATIAVFVAAHRAGVALEEAQRTLDQMFP